MFCSGRRGQLLTTDFILSLAIFLAILLASMNIWANVDTQIKDAEARRDMQAITTDVSENLVRNPGYPKDWTNETVRVIGLAKDEHVIEIGKILQLKHTDYDKVRDLLRLGNYNYRIWITDAAGYDLTSGIVRGPVAVIVHKKSGMEYAKMLDKSVVTWDLYYDDSAIGVEKIDAPAANGFSARYKYPTTLPLTTKDSLNTLMSNQSSYRTVIIEDIGLQNDSVADISQLVDFVNRGGVLIYTDTDVPQPKKPLIENWSRMSFEANSNPVISYVNNSAPLLANSSLKDNITFSSHQRDVFRDKFNTDIPLNFISNSTSTRCQICWWDYGFGRIYYIENNQGWIYNASDAQTYSLTPFLNIVGENMTMGISPNNGTDLVSIRRMAILSGFEREVVNVNLVVWR